MTPSEKLASEVARAIIADLERGCPLSGSSMRFDPVTGVVDYEGAFRPVEIAQAAIAIVVQKAAEVARSLEPDSLFDNEAAALCSSHGENIANALLALSDRSREV